MKTKSAASITKPEPLEEQVRDYAYHLYEQGGCTPGHDLDNWLEAKACIVSNIPRQNAHNRLHRHLELAPRAAR